MVVDEMNEPKWTPGPWYAGHIADDTTDCNCASIVSEYCCGSIAYVTVDNGKSIGDGGNDGPPLEQAKANSFLIAEAPGLYEALERLVKFIDDCDFRFAQGDTVKTARIALAKARGEDA